MKTVLFVDDEEMNLFILNRLFSNDFNVITASSAAEGIEVIREQLDEIDAVVTDLKMPEVSGLQMLGEVEDLLQGKPKLLLTGYNYHAEIDEALASKKITGVFKKPFDFEEIREVLQKQFK